MADQPRHQDPYNNMSPVPKFTPGDAPSPSVVPKGKGASKVAQSQLALRGLVGAK